MLSQHDFGHDCERPAHVGMDVAAQRFPSDSRRARPRRLTSRTATTLCVGGVEEGQRELTRRAARALRSHRRPSVLAAASRLLSLGWAGMRGSSIASCRMVRTPYGEPVQIAHCRARCAAMHARKSARGASSQAAWARPRALPSCGATLPAAPVRRKRTLYEALGRSRRSNAAYNVREFTLSPKQAGRCTHHHTGDWRPAPRAAAYTVRPRSRNRTLPC